MTYFFQLPYYFDGDAKITQSNAIIRHIARKNGLCGKSDEEIDRVDVLENVAMDFRNDFVRICYNSNFVSILFELILFLESQKTNISILLLEQNWRHGDKTFYFLFRWIYFIKACRSNRFTTPLPLL